MAIANETCVSFCNQPNAHFGLPWVWLWDNLGKCYMDEKRIQCWSNASQHISIYLQPFTSYRLLPRLLYGCEIWSLSSVNIRDLIIWNNCFRHVFNCCWRERVKPLRFYCNNLLLSYKKTVFFRKLFSSNNRILRALITLNPGHNPPDIIPRT